MPAYGPPPPPGKNHTNAIIIGAAITVIATIIGSGVIIANIRDSEASPAPTVTVTVTAEAAPEADTAEAEDTTPSTAQTDFKVGDKASNRGTIVKIIKVTEGSTITLQGATKKAGGGAKYVTLQTVVTNETKASMDLTCSLPIVNALIDDQNRRFDTIDSLYDVAGNPECNAQLQPGFKDNMQFVYRVPDDAKIATWEFYEYDLETEPTPTLVDLT